MTHRTEELNPPTPVEKATEAVMIAINEAITVHHAREGVMQRQRIAEKEFRRILALYFHSMSITDWSHRLGIEDVSDPGDHGEHGGEA